MLRRVARIEEVYRILEVLNSIGVRTRWINDGVDLEIVPPAELDLDAMDDGGRPPHPQRSSCSSARCCTAWTASASRTRAAATSAPAPSQPHMIALRHFGLDITATEGTLPRGGATATSPRAAPSC